MKPVAPRPSSLLLGLARCPAILCTNLLCWYKAVCVGKSLPADVARACDNPGVRQLVYVCAWPCPSTLAACSALESLDSEAGGSPLKFPLARLSPRPCYLVHQPPVLV